MPFEIVRNDITKMNTEAIVNAANASLEAGGGVCGAIYNAAGMQELQKACSAIGRCETGQAVITAGFNLPAKYIIHTVGPVWQGGAQNEEALLRLCYKNTLGLAKKHGISSVAFPLISSGVFGYPKKEALQVAISEIKAFLLNNEMDVYLVVFDKQMFDISQSRYHAIQSFISERYVEARMVPERTRMQKQTEFVQESEIYADALELVSEQVEVKEMPLSASVLKKKSLADVVNQLKDPFSQMLLNLIDEKGFTDTEVYKRANIDRKLFSKIRSNPEYKPSKQTAIALAFALKLSLDETKDLLMRAGYALSRSSKFDVIVEFFLEQGICDIYEVNEALFAFDQVPLGGAIK